MALKACQVCGASIQVTSRDAEVVCSECGAEYDVLVHGASTYSVSVASYVDTKYVTGVKHWVNGVEKTTPSSTTFSAPKVVSLKAVESVVYDGVTYVFKRWMIWITDVKKWSTLSDKPDAEVNLAWYLAASLKIEYAKYPIPPKVDTKLTLSVSPSELIADSVTFSGRLTRVDTGAGLAGKVARIMVKEPGAATFTYDPFKATDSMGNYVVDYSVTKIGLYEFYAEFIGDETFNASRSPTVSVRVTAPTTKLEIGFVVKPVKLGDIAEIQGKLTADTIGLDGFVVYMHQRKNTGPWTLASQALTRDGAFTWKSLPLEAGTYNWQAKFEGYLAYPPAESNIIGAAVEVEVVPVPMVLTVTVKDAVTGKLLPDARVLIDTTEFFTDEAGTVVYSVPSVGTYEVSISKKDYKSTTRTVEVPEAGAVLEVGLWPIWAIGAGVVGAAAVGTIVIAKAVKK